MEEKKEDIELDNNLIDEELTDDDFEEKEKKEEKTSKKTQSREENKFFADLRRKNAELEKKNKELEVKANEADFNARKKAISRETLDELGIDSIEDENDLLLCEEYVKANNKGVENPILEANKALRKKIREDNSKLSAAEKEEESNKLKVQKDKEELKRKFNIDSQEVLKDKKFMALFGDMISYGNLTYLYEKYLSINTMKDEDFENESKQMGVIPNSSSRNKKAEKSINDLDGDDFLKAFKEKYH